MTIEIFAVNLIRLSFGEATINTFQEAEPNNLPTRSVDMSFLKGE